MASITQTHSNAQPGNAQENERVLKSINCATKTIHTHTQTFICMQIMHKIHCRQQACERVGPSVSLYVCMCVCMSSRKGLILQ